MSEFVGSEGIAFDFIVDDIDRMEKKLKETSETNRANGSKGGRPRKQAEPEENRNKPTETEENPTKPYKDKDKDKDIKETLLTECKEKKRFTPPTVEDVAEYCRERNNGIDAQTFVDFYQAKGWMIGKNPVRDWKACVRTWESNNRKNALPTKTVVAQQYEQRDYSSEQDEAMRRMLELGGTG